MSARPEEKTEIPFERVGRALLPASLGTSALLHASLLAAAILFKLSLPDLQMAEIHNPTLVAQLALPPDFIKPPEPPPEEALPAAPFEAPQVAQAPPEKLDKQAPRQVKLKRKALPTPQLAQEPPTLNNQPSAPIEYVVKADSDPNPQNSSPSPQILPEDDGQGSDQGLSRTGDPNGVIDPRAADSGKNPPAAQAGDGVDLKALMRGYIGSVNQAVRKDYTYPLAAKRARIEGVVLVELVVDARGNIVSVTIASSSGFEVLDQAAIASVRSVGRLPAPPDALGWDRKTLRVPFKYQIKQTG